MDKFLSLDEFRSLVLGGKAPEPDTLVRTSLVTEQLEPIGPVEDRRLRFVISNGSVDRDNDTINPGGWKLDAFRKNPVVLWAHDYHDLPVARAVEIGSDGGRLVAVAEFASAEDYPFAETVFRLLKKGFLSATSVGFKPLKYAINEERRGLDFSEAELLEFSIVPVPANAEALVVARAAGDPDVDELRAWAQRVLDATTKTAGAEGTDGDPLPAAAHDDSPSASDDSGPSLEPAPPVDKQDGDVLVVHIDGNEVARFATAGLSLATESGGVVVGKQGRVLSAANEGKLRQCRELLDAVLVQVEATVGPDEEDDSEEQAAAATPEAKAPEACCHGKCNDRKLAKCNDKKCDHKVCATHGVDGTCEHCAKASAPEVTAAEPGEPDVLALDDEVVVELDDEVEVEVTPADIQAALQAAASEVLTQVVREQTQATLDRLRGRVV